MIKVIATIDLLRGIPDDLDLPSVAEYIDKKVKTGNFISNADSLNELMVSQADELYITQLCSDLNCKRFFPKFEDNFRLTKRSPIKKENGLEFQHQIWRRISRP